MTQVDLWTLENELRTPDTEPLCGVDEAGRGPLAGPVCAAAVMLPPGLEIPGLNDSKKLSEKKREALYDTIIAQALSYGIAFATVEEIEEKFRMARSLGFDNINMDLIVGLPGEDKEKVAHTLEKVEALNPDSLTVHSLALKRATRLNLFKDKYQEISFENSAEIMKMTMDSAHRMEMGPYYMYRQKNMAGNFENVGYSREGKAGIYNILIMEEKQSILAAGAGASTKFVFEHGERIERVENVKDLKNYVERIDEMIERKRIGMEKYLPK